MTSMEVMALVLAMGLLVYLVLTLLFPERF